MPSSSLQRDDSHSLVEQARRLLGECGLFRGIGLKERQELFSRVHVRHFAVGETIFMKGSPGENMLAVLDGNVRIGVDSSEGRGLVLAVLFPGDLRRNCPA